MMNDIISIEKMIYEIRGQKVMLDSELAELYQIETKKLIQAVKRNIERFPGDFMFQLTNEEFTVLRSQFVTSSWGGRRYMPYAFTEHGILMLSSVLNSSIAINSNIIIMRAFVKMRHYALSHDSLAGHVNELKKMLLLHIDYTTDKLSEHEKKINDIITALNYFTDNPIKPREIGFKKD